MTLDPSTPAGARALPRLASERIGWLATVTPDGQPQVFPVWFLWDEDEILVYSHHRARRNENIAMNPRVAFHLHTNEGGGDVVVLEGDARVDGTVPPVTENGEYLAKYGEWIDQQLNGAESMARVYSVPIRIRPTRVRAAW